MNANGVGALPSGIDVWVSAQRWFAQRGHVPVLRSIGEFSLPSGRPGVRLRTCLVYDTLALRPVLYQLPLAEYDRPVRGAEASLIGEAPGLRADQHGPSDLSRPRDTDGGARYVYDGPHDPVYAQALLTLILGGQGSVAPDGVTRAWGHAAGTRATHGQVSASRVLSGEQSNTSIICELVDGAGATGRPVIVKVFRALQAGENPDVAVQSALAAAGSRLVPEPVGHVTGQWMPREAASGRLTGSGPVLGHLAVAQEFLPNVEDAWRTALAAAEAGWDFRGEARSLGQATAEVHADLARAFPRLPATPALIEGIVTAMRARLAAAVIEVPALAECAPAAEAIIARAASADWPALQRVHGDYHLGQVLRVPGRGWVLVDFEGEPLRPLSERVTPDVVLRDVAGMLRSFAYAASTVQMSAPGRDPVPVARWGAACRGAFLSGYAERSPLDLNRAGAILVAFELDKAVYETVYETRNRPDWLPIPLGAVRALTGPRDTAFT